MPQRALLRHHRFCMQPPHVLQRILWWGVGVGLKKNGKCGNDSLFGAFMPAYRKLHCKKNEVLYNYYGHLSYARKFEVRAKYCGNTVCFYYARTR